MRDKRIRELIGQLADDQHTLDRYVEIGKSYDTSKSNAQACQLGHVTAAVNTFKSQSSNGNSENSQTKCQRSCKFHKKDECKAIRNKCFNCDKVGHFAKMCRCKCQSNSSCNQQKKLTLKHRDNATNVYLVTDDVQNLGAIDWETVKQVFEGIALTGSIDILSDNDTCNVSYASKNVNMNSVQQNQKVRHLHMLKCFLQQAR